MQAIQETSHFSSEEKVLTLPEFKPSCRFTLFLLLSKAIRFLPGKSSIEMIPLMISFRSLQLEVKILRGKSLSTTDIWKKKVVM